METGKSQHEWRCISYCFHGDFPLFEDVFPIEHGDFPLFEDVFPIEHGDFPPFEDVFPIEHGDFPPFEDVFPIVSMGIFHYLKMYFLLFPWGFSIIWRCISYWTWGFSIIWRCISYWTWGFSSDRHVSVQKIWTVFAECFVVGLASWCPKKARFLGLKDSPAGSVALGGTHQRKKRHYIDGFACVFLVMAGRFFSTTLWQSHGWDFFKLQHEMWGNPRNFQPSC